jgi:uncharacterized membrane protein YdbT with pleckstrin-like domain
MDHRDLLRGERVVATVRMDPFYFLMHKPSLILFGVVTLGIGPYLLWKFSVLYFTNKRIVARTGTFAKNLADVDVRKINQVLVRQSFFDRILGVGYIKFETNDQYHLSFGPIADPYLVRKIAQEQMYGQDGARASA